MTLLEAPELAPRLPSNSLLADSVARLVSAASVESRLAVELAVELDVLLALAAVPGVAAIRLPLTLPIDIMDSDRDCWNPAYRPRIAQLESPREKCDAAGCAPSAHEGAQRFFCHRLDHQGVKSSVPCVRVVFHGAITGGGNQTHVSKRGLDAARAGHRKAVHSAGQP